MVDHKDLENTIQLIEFGRLFAIGFGTIACAVLRSCTGCCKARLKSQLMGLVSLTLKLLLSLLVQTMSASLGSFCSCSRRAASICQSRRIQLP